jgi:hypothetical protein
MITKCGLSMAFSPVTIFVLGLQLLFQLRDPRLNPLPNAAIGAFLPGFFKPLNLRLDLCDLSERKHDSLPAF